MAVTSDAFTASDLVGVIPEKWTPMVMEEFFAKPTISDFVTDLSELAREGGDIFHKRMWRVMATLRGKCRKLQETLLS